MKFTRSTQANGAWDEAKIISYAYAYEQATYYRRPPASVPPLGPGAARSPL